MQSSTTFQVRLLSIRLTVIVGAFRYSKDCCQHVLEILAFIESQRHVPVDDDSKPQNCRFVLIRALFVLYILEHDVNCIFRELTFPPPYWPSSLLFTELHRLMPEGQNVSVEALNSSSLI